MHVENFAWHGHQSIDAYCAWERAEHPHAKPGRSVDHDAYWRRRGARGGPPVSAKEWPAEAAAPAYAASDWTPATAKALDQGLRGAGGDVAATRITRMRHNH